ncbi:hypothetical protein Tco_1104909 [Tanacetum coccineum]
MKNFDSIPQRHEEDCHSIKDDIPLVYKDYVKVLGGIKVKKRKQFVGEVSSPRKSLKVTIKRRQPSTTPIPPPSDDRERDEIAEATLLSLTLNKTTLVAEAQKNVAKVQEKLIEDDSSKMVEGDEKELYASEFVDFVFNNDAYFGTRLKPGSHKENTETVDDDDEEEKKDDKKDDNDNDDQDVMAVEGLKKRRSITEALEEEAMVVRLVLKKKKPEGLRQMSVRGIVPPLSVTVLKGVGEYPRVLARYIGYLASGSDLLAPDFEEAHAAHNMIYGLYYPLLKDKLWFLTFDELVDVYDIHALQLAVVVKDLRFENALNLLNLEELSMMQRVAASSIESRKKLVEEVDEENFVLTSQLEAAKLEKSKFVKYFLPLALDEVHGLGDSCDLKDVQDYHPEAEKIFDEDAEAFYKLEFPYISLLVENVGMSSEELASLEALSVQEAPLL